MKAPIQSGILYPTPESKKAQSRKVKRFFVEASKLLGTSFEFHIRFNAGGIAVWGETYAKIYQGGKPVIEAYDTSMGILTRQWDGNHSGGNHYVVTDTDGFVDLVKQLATKPFVRF